MTILTNTQVNEIIGKYLNSFPGEYDFPGDWHEQGWRYEFLDKEGQPLRRGQPAGDIVSFRLVYYGHSQKSP